MKPGGYHSSGVFKFASEIRDQATGIPAKTGPFGGSGNHYGLSGHVVVSDGGKRRIRVPERNVDGNRMNTTMHTVYDYETGGLLVTITRVGGSSGRIKVSYTTVDGDQIHDHYTYDTVNGILIPDGARRFPWSLTRQRRGGSQTTCRFPAR